MKTSVLTFDQVSKEIKTKISKIGKDALVKRFTEGKLTSQEEVVAAAYYLLKRESMTQKEINKIEATLYVDVLIPEVKETIDLSDYKEPLKKTRTLGSVKGTEISVTEKLTETPIVKLTAQEFPLFEQIKKAYKKTGNATMEYTLIDKKYENYREFKGILGSLMKKGIVSYDQDGFTVEKLGLEMIEGQIAYKEKAKNEQNFFKTKRLVIKVEGKEYEKSAFVRMRLRKNNNLTCIELNKELAELGFGKLYHSELQRCKDQLGIVTVKEQD